MRKDEEVVYTIEIIGFTDPHTARTISDCLSRRQVPSHYHRIVLPIASADPEPGAVLVPRLFTRWRGDLEEETWQESLKTAKPLEGLEVAISVAPWSPAPGYPQGEIGEKGGATHKPTP